MATNPTSTFLFSSPPLSPKLLTLTFSLPSTSQSSLSSPLKFRPIFNPPVIVSRPSRNNPFLVHSDDGDADGGGPDDFEMDQEELEEVDNKKDFEIEYDPLAAALGLSVSGGDEDIAMVQSKNFVSTQGWDSEMVVDYRINEEEFHKISLYDCDFFIRKPPDPDTDVYDFREVSGNNSKGI